MLLEIHQIKEFLARHYGLPYEDGCVVGYVPDCEHIIPLGVHLTPMKAGVRNGYIFIESKPPE